MEYYSQPHLPWYINKKFYNKISPIMVEWMQSMTFHDWWGMKVRSGIKKNVSVVLVIFFVDLFFLI
jgi:hypothetical protein